MSKHLLITEELCMNYGIDMDELPFKDTFTITDAETNLYPDHFLHWVYYTLPLTDDDKEFYLEYMKIKGSKAFFSSRAVTNCQHISNSAMCENSSSVYDSKLISDSKQVIRSQDVICSTKVIDSNLIYNSTNIKESSDISKSDNIGGSSLIQESTNIAYCSLVSNSHFLVDCHNISESKFSRDLINCSNKILCYGLKDNDDYMVFNKKVSYAAFHAINRLLNELLRDVKIQFTSEKEDIMNSTKMVSKYLIFYNTFVEHSKILQAIEQQVVNYSKDAMYELTLIP